MTVPSAPELLRQHHLRVTAPRVAVLDVLGERSHLTTEEVAAAVRQRIGTLSMQAGYHVLDTLVAVGLLRRIEPAGSPARYERRVGDNHHHLVCRSCGIVVDVDCHRQDGRCLEPTDPHGFEVDEAEVVFWGRCPDCRPAGPTPNAKTTRPTPTATTPTATPRSAR
ncbi:MAG TPA: Fur family transcriptional regulator [Candidatus Lustribacter sp.]|nr:Fur family transcriptional regulator [Candidatus Lustribacter sp.]